MGRIVELDPEYKDGFFHYRKRVLNELGIEIILPHGGVTVYWDVADIKGGKFDLRYAVAICSEKDTYCKRTGRRKALGRYHSATHGYKRMELNPDDDLAVAKKAALEFLSRRCKNLSKQGVKDISAYYA